MSRRKNIKNRLKGEPMGAEDLDIILQAQLEHLAKVARGATGSDIMILIAHSEDSGQLQTAISSRGGDGSASQLQEAVRAMVTVAATTLKAWTHGKAELVMKVEGKEMDPTQGAHAVMINRADLR